MDYVSCEADSFNMQVQDLIFAMGIRFWSDLVVTENISSIEKCSDVLSNLKMIGESKETFQLQLVPGDDDGIYTMINQTPVPNTENQEIMPDFTTDKVTENYDKDTDIKEDYEDNSFTKEVVSDDSDKIEKQP